MKLKEPLYGFKMISGHIISNFAMFFIQSRINVVEYYDPDSEFKKTHKIDGINFSYELQIFNFVMYMHLAAGIT
jgi:hypothetical protein